MEFNYWFLAEDLVKTKYQSSVVLIYDEDGSAYDDPEEYVPGLNVKSFVFNSLNEAKEFIDNSDLNIFDSFTFMWVNGVPNKDLIYELRG